MVANSPETSEVIERSQGGAPAIGHAVTDFFSTDEIFQRVAASADEEFGRGVRLLFFSGLAAGLSVGLSFYARAAITAQVPNDLLGNLLYPIGFLLIVIGRYQLYTENTLTPVTLVLTRLASIPSLLKNWGIVLTANLVGAFILAFFLANTAILSNDATTVAIDLGLHALETPMDALFFKGVMAGWLVASMVWLIHAARDTITRVFLVFFIMYLIPSAELYHCIVGACEVFYVAFKGEAGFIQGFFTFIVPVVAGNTVGGVLLVAILNYAQTADDKFQNREGGLLELSWREWLFEFHTGRPQTVPNGGKGKQYQRLTDDVDEDDYILGSIEAPVTLVQYGDYECPTSQKIYHLARDLEHHLNSQNYSYVFRELPLTRRHPHAMNAARAAAAADLQNRFWDMHEKLFENIDDLEEEDLMQYASDLNLNMDKFENEFNSNQFDEQIERNRESAVRNGVYTTSNLFINGERYTGEMTIDALKQKVSTMLTHLTNGENANAINIREGV